MTEIMRILLADDGSRAASSARLLAVALARDTHAKLSLLYVKAPLDEPGAADVVLAEAKRLAEEAGVPFDVLEAPPVGVSNIGRRVVRVADDCGADLIVLGARGLGAVGRLVMGSVSGYVANHAPCSVLVARPSGGVH